MGDLPPGKSLSTPHTVIRSRLNIGQRESLVQWIGCSHEEAIWDPFEHFQVAYPDFKLEEKQQAEVGSDDMDAFTENYYKRKEST